MSVPLRFPSMLVHVAPGTRFEMVSAGTADKVEYHIGDPAVCFVVAREEIPEESFFGVQLALQLKDVGRGADGALRVVLKEYPPLLFPLVFAYIRQVFATPSTAKVHTEGLNVEETDQLAELVGGFLQIANPRMALLFRANAPRFDAAEFRVVARGRLIENMKRSRFGAQPSTASRNIVATLSPDGVITCVQSNGVVRTTLTVSLRKIPTSAPWARSIMEDDILALQRSARSSARERVSRAPDDLIPTLACDELPPLPDDDDRLMRYPYPVDHESDFFVPAAAIVCKTEAAAAIDPTVSPTPIVCEGVYRCDEDQIRIDALDQEDHSWFWLELNVSKV